MTLSVTSTDDEIRSYAGRFRRDDHAYTTVVLYREGAAAMGDSWWDGHRAEVHWDAPGIPVHRFGPVRG